MKAKALPSENEVMKSTLALKHLIHNTLAVIIINLPRASQNHDWSYCFCFFFFLIGYGAHPKSLGRGVNIYSLFEGLRE